MIRGPANLEELLKLTFVFHTSGKEVQFFYKIYNDDMDQMHVIAKISLQCGMVRERWLRSYAFWLASIAGSIWPPMAWICPQGKTKSSERTL